MSSLALMLLMGGCQGACEEPAIEPEPDPLMWRGCELNEECDAAQVCFSTARGGGFCTLRQAPCPPGALWLEDATALLGQGVGVCLPAWDERCPSAPRTLSDVQVCVPDAPNLGAVTMPSFDEVLEAQQARCDAALVPGQSALWTLDFTPREGAKMSTVVPFVAQGTLEVISVSHPGKVTTLEEDYKAHRIRLASLSEPHEPEGVAARVSMDWPVMLPYAPQLSEVLAPGQRHTLTVRAQEAPCLLEWDALEQGDRLELEVYLVPAWLEAADAPFEPRFQVVVQQLRRLLASAGFKRVELRFNTLSKQDASRFTVITTKEKIRSLTALGRYEGLSLPRLKTISMFMVEDIIISSQPGLVGQSMGLPGAVGLAGNAKQGLVFSAQELGRDHAKLATIMAHELGHYLGLRHTTELYYGSRLQAAKQLDALVGLEDPFPETPRCDEITTSLRSCPDLSNVMFPALPQDPNVLLSMDWAAPQRWVMRHHPAAFSQPEQAEQP